MQLVYPSCILNFENNSRVHRPVVTVHRRHVSKILIIAFGSVPLLLSLVQVSITVLLSNKKIDAKENAFMIAISNLIQSKRIFMSSLHIVIRY